MDVIEGDVSLTPLNATNVTAIQSRGVRERFLAQAARTTEFAKSPTKVGQLGEFVIWSDRHYPTIWG